MQSSRLSKRSSSGPRTRYAVYCKPNRRTVEGYVGSGLLSALLSLRCGMRPGLLRRLRGRRQSFGLLQLLRDRVHKTGLVHKHLADKDSALVRLLPLVFFHGFADSGNRLHAVAGVGAGSIDLVLEPRPLLEALVDGERPLGQQQFDVDFLQRGRLPGCTGIFIHPRNGLTIALGGPSVSLRSVLQRREV